MNPRRIAIFQLRLVVQRKKLANRRNQTLTELFVQPPAIKQNDGSPSTAATTGINKERAWKIPARIRTNVATVQALIGLLHATTLLLLPPNPKQLLPPCLL